MHQPEPPTQPVSARPSANGTPLRPQRSAAGDESTQPVRGGAPTDTTEPTRVTDPDATQPATKPGEATQPTAPATQVAGSGPEAARATAVPPADATQPAAAVTRKAAEKAVEAAMAEADAAASPVPSLPGQEHSLTDLCERAAGRIAQSLPVPWTRAWLRVEPTGGIALIFCWFQAAEGAPANYFELPPQALDELAQIFHAVRRTTAAAGEADWDEATLFLDATVGTFSLDYEASGATDAAAQLDRQIAWQHRYLHAS